MIAFFLSLLMCWTLRLALPLFKSDQLEKRTRKNVHIFFCKILKDKWFHVNELLKRFHLNGHTIGFHTQTQKLELQTKKVVHVKLLLKRFHLNGHTIGFHQQTQKLELCTKQIVPSATTAEEASFEWPNHRISSSQTQKLQKHYKSPRMKKFICDNLRFNTYLFFMVKVALNDHLSLFRFQTAGIPKIKQE